MIDIEYAKQRAEQNFLDGYNCAQSVLEVFCSEFGLSKDLVLKSAQAFGGGTCRLREMCGCVSGMLIALGYIEGSCNPKDKTSKDELYKKGQMLCGAFREKNGSFICRELLGLAPLGDSQKYLTKNSVNGDSTSPISEKRTDEYYKKRPCPKLCASAAEIFANYMNSK